ncbi:MAG: gliding motility-associated C-terminal domain-containing protein [Saprospiraceae bacterium]
MMQKVAQLGASQMMPITLVAPADRTVDCTPPAPQMPAASTTCQNSDVRLTLREVQTNYTCENDFTLLRIWTATDDCMNMARDTQIIRVKDDRAPSLFLTDPRLAGLGDGDTLYVQCDDVMDFNEDDGIAGDNCDSNPTIQFVDYVQHFGDCRIDGYIRLMKCGWTAYDNCGNSTSIAITFIVIDTTPPVFLPYPDTIDVDCNRLNSVSIEAEDNCSENVVISNKDWVMPGDCVGEAMIVRTWHAYDDCGNHTSAQQIINLRDTTPPALNGVPDDLNLSCGDSIPAAPVVTAQDNCDSTITLIADERMEGDICLQRIVRTWEAEDDCGNLARDSQVILIVDNSPPVILFAPQDTTIECDAPEPNEQPLFEDICTDSVDIIAISGIILDTCGYRIEKAWTAIDPCGNSTTVTQVITVIDTQNPVLTGVPGDMTVSCDSIPAPAVVTVQDNCDSTIVLNFNEELTKTDSCETWEIVRTWSASDNCGNSVSARQVLTIVDNSAPVFLTVPMDTTIECDDSIPPVINPMVADNCDNDPTLVYTEDVRDGTCEGTSLIMRVWTAYDECGNSATVRQRITVIDTTGPTITFVNPILTGLGNGDTIRFECDSIELLNENDVVAVDNCSDVDVTFDEIGTSSSDCSQDGYIEKLFCTWTATDDCGNSSTLSLIVLIIDTTPPILVNVPADTLLSCDERFPDPGIVSGQDNCNLNVIVTFNDSLAIGSCFGNFEVFRTWTATDFCGNISTARQIITVRDTLAPEFDVTPEDTSVSCDAIPPFALITATDNCEQNIMVDTSSVIIPGNCPGNFTIERTWTAADGCGNSNSFTQIITVEDNQAPVFGSIPASLYSDCQDTIPAMNAPTVSDNCDANPILSFEEERIDGNCANNFQIIRTWIATDACGNESSVSQVISYLDTIAPEAIYIPEDQIANCDSAIIISDEPIFTDNCSDSITVTLDQTISNGNCANSYTLENRWTATDDCGNSSTVVQRIEVGDNAAPEFVSVPADTTIACDAPLPIQEPIVTDACDTSVTLNVSLDTIPGSCPQNLQIVRTWTAEDDCGNTATASQNIFVIDTVAPEIVFINPDLAPANSGDTIYFECDYLILLNENDVEVNDNCADVILTFHEEVISSGDCEADGYFEQLICTWVAEDPCGNVDSFFLNVILRDNTPPTFVFVPNDTTINCTDSFPDLGDVIVEDNCNVGNILVELEEITNPGGCAGFFTITRIWTATDICGNTATASQLVQLTDNTPPVFTFVPADTTIQCDQFPLPGYDAVAVDACDPNITLTEQQTTVPGNCPQNFTLTRTWTATDACGNESTASQTIIVIDSIAPQFVSIFNDTTISCENIFAPDTPSVVDNCDPNFILQLSETQTAGSCANEYTIVRTWTAADACGNVNSFTQNIFVVDQTPPVFDNLPPNISLNCSDTLPTAINPSVSDNCSSNISLSSIDIPFVGNCPHNFEIRRLWTATDECGNTSTAQQIFSFIDTIAPVILDIPADTTINCDDLLPMAMPSNIQDNCDANPTVRMDQQMLGTNCIDFRVERTWTITDACGNSNSYSQTVRLEDNQAPFFANVPQNMMVSCDSIPDSEDPDVSDNCDPAPALSMTESIVPGACTHSYTIIRTWTAMDICGNTADTSQTIMVKDTTAPQISLDLPNYGSIAFGDTLRIECDDLITIDSASAMVTDNCDVMPDVEFVEYITASTDCNIDGYLTFMDCRWIATDDCGNTDSLVIYVVIVDTTAPVITGVGPDTIIYAALNQSVPPVPNPNASDNCDGNPVITFQDGLKNDFCGYDIVRRWFAEDECGNIGFEDQLVRVEASFTIDTVDVTEATCGLNDGQVDIRVLGDEANYVFTWTPDLGIPNTNNNARTDLPPGIYTVNIHLQDFEFCNQEIEIEVGDGCDPLIRDTVYVNLEQQSQLFCLDASVLQDPTPMVSAEVCYEGFAGAVSLTNLNGRCYTLKAANGFTGQAPEAICVVHCFESGFCDTTIIIPTVDVAVFDPCLDDEVTNMIEDVSLQHSDCDNPLEICLDVPLAFTSDFEFHLNGEKWTQAFDKCDAYANFVFDLNDLLPLNNGVYRINSWKVHNTTFSGDFETITDLLALLNNWAPEGNWSFNPANNEISGQAEFETSIGRLDIAAMDGGNQYSILPKKIISAALPLYTGNNFLEIENLVTGCFNDAQVDIFCITPDDMFAYIMVDETKSMCVDLGELPGNFTTMESILLTNNPALCAKTEIVGDFCIEMTGLEIGREKLCLIAHDDRGMVDTTYLYIEVGEERPEVTVFDGFSPNGDGQNDLFTIDNIEYYPESKLTIFNRWGNQVFEAKGYQNDWSGQYGTKELPDGVYFYILELGDGKTLNGDLTLLR